MVPAHRQYLQNMVFVNLNIFFFVLLSINIYCTFILPFRDACEVQGGCSKADGDKLQKVQFEAARIVTGMPLFASRDSLYFETGWEKLKDRQNRRKLTLFHKIKICKSSICTSHISCKKRNLTCPKYRGMFLTLCFKSII